MHIKSAAREMIDFIGLLFISCKLISAGQGKLLLLMDGSTSDVARGFLCLCGVIYQLPSGSAQVPVASTHPPYGSAHVSVTSVHPPDGSVNLPVTYAYQLNGSAEIPVTGVHATDGSVNVSVTSVCPLNGSV